MRPVKEPPTKATAGTTSGESSGAAGDPILPLTLYGPELSYFTGSSKACFDTWSSPTNAS